MHLSQVAKTSDDIRSQSSDSTLWLVLGATHKYPIFLKISMLLCLNRLSIMLRLPKAQPTPWPDGVRSEVGPAHSAGDSADTLLVFLGRRRPMRSRDAPRASRLQHTQCEAHVAVGGGAHGVAPIVVSRAGEGSSLRKPTHEWICVGAIIAGRRCVRTGDAALCRTVALARSAVGFRSRRFPPKSHHVVDQPVSQRDQSEEEMSVRGGVYSKLPKKKQSSRLFPSLQSVRLAEIEDALSHSRVENMTMENSG
jgi:hypothetical protein